MSNEIVPGCLVLIIKGPRTGTSCHVVREVESCWKRSSEKEWVLDFKIEDGRTMAGPESFLRRIDGFDPSLDEIVELINDKELVK